MSVNWHQALSDDRGLAFGDGCFETLRLHQGQAPFWVQHKQRLLRGLDQLKINACESVLESILAKAQQEMPSGVLKIIVTRGNGGRGYSSSNLNQPNYYPRLHAFQPLAEKIYVEGLHVGKSQVQLASQPLLAGIKHLNRLEQVLARQEIEAQGWHEAVLYSTNNEPVELSAMNLFIRYPSGWWTSSLLTAGVKGVARDWVLQNMLEPVQISEQAPNSVEHIIEAFGCNSIMGVVPIKRFSSWSGAPGKHTLYLQQQWNLLWND